MRQFAMLLSVIAPVSLSLEYGYLGFRSAQVPFTSAIVPGQVFPINICQKIHTVLCSGSIIISLHKKSPLGRLAEKAPPSH
jgi:hypothetical protein